MGIVIILVKLFWKKPEQRYKYESIQDDLELGSSNFPVVLIQIPMFNEKEVYKVSIGAACNLSWPADRLVIQVLDNSIEPTIKFLTCFVVVAALLMSHSKSNMKACMANTPRKLQLKRATLQAREECCKVTLAFSISLPGASNSIWQVNEVCNMLGKRRVYGSNTFKLATS
ncbi:hypothetical protein AHAS_Ahas19G0086600 [Arachis hypogaea]